MLPIGELVAFPHLSVLLEAESEAAISAIEFVSQSSSGELIALGQHDSDGLDDSDDSGYSVDPADPALAASDISKLSRVGVRARIISSERTISGAVRVQLECIERVRAKRIRRQPQNRVLLVASFSSFPLKPLATNNVQHLEDRIRYSYKLFQEYLHLRHENSAEKTRYLNSLPINEKLIYVIADMLDIDNKRRMQVLSATSLNSMVADVNRILTIETDLLRVERKIDHEIMNSVARNQRDTFLRERIKGLARELGSEDDDEIAALLKRVNNANLPQEVEARAEKEIRKVTRVGSAPLDAAVAQAWLDCILSLPWQKHSEDTRDLELARRCLEDDHFGLEEIKERILDHIAVMIRTGEPPKAQILCFVGPPGVGKTSLGRSIARALNKRFARISLGGVHDEAEIRGHRRAYVGAMPGRITQALQKAGTTNPLILLDEVDKMSRSWNGDPAAALLEVLDPEQNKFFSDNFLGVDLDLSQVLFITTANSLLGIPETLRDRMEIIRLPGYLEPEKIAIAERFLIPKQLGSCGISSEQVTFADGTISAVIRGWTREAGVRDLERRIARISRKLARKLASKELTEGASSVITASELPDLLGPPLYKEDDQSLTDQTGVASGLAFTGTGGELLEIEVSVVPGRGRLQLTGTLGDVIKESALAALSYVRARASTLGLSPDFHRTRDIHIHLPAGATPKDGPSAGIALATALASALTGVPVRGDVAMTGEITLRGRVLSVGGIREKGVAAHRYRLKHVILPYSNQRDVSELPVAVRKEITWHCVKTMDEVLDLALRRVPASRKLAKRGKHQTQKKPPSDSAT